MSYNSLVTGPEMSPRFGRVIRVALAKGSGVTCNFACAYCRSADRLPPAATSWWREGEVLSAVDAALSAHRHIDGLVLSGNGEPTLHLGFALIVDGLLRLRSERAPSLTLAVVSNGSTLDRVEVRRALSLLDLRIMKLDAGDATTYRLVNGGRVPIGPLIAGLRHLGRVDLRATFVRDAERRVDNTSPAAVEAWLSAVREIQPRHVEVCGRDSQAAHALKEVPLAELVTIAGRVERLGIPAMVV